MESKETHLTSLPITRTISFFGFDCKGRLEEHGRHAPATQNFIFDSATSRTIGLRFAMWIIISIAGSRSGLLSAEDKDDVFGCGIEGDGLGQVVGEVVHGGDFQLGDLG